LIIIDDCGKEPLSEIELPKDDRIQTYQNYYNLGAGKTRQRGLNLSNGEFVAFLDADDWWDPEFLETCLKKLLMDANCDGVYVKSKLVFKDNQTDNRRYSDLGLENIIETIIGYARPWQTGSVLWRNSRINDWGLLKTNEDAFFEVKSSHFNRLVPINQYLLYIDKSLEITLSNYYSLGKSQINHQELFLMIFKEKLDKVSFNSKIVLYHRLTRGQLKIYEYCSSTTARVFRDRLYEHSKMLGFIGRSKRVLNLVHYILQNSPYKIHY
jgi:glycosyltransferase involved in cell wall biosynthesis